MTRKRSTEVGRFSAFARPVRSGCAMSAELVRRIARGDALEISPALPELPRVADIPISTKAALAAATDEAAPPSAGPSLTSPPQPKPPADKPAVSTPAPAMIQPLQAAASPTAPIAKSAAAPAATASPRAAVPVQSQPEVTAERGPCPRRRPWAFLGLPVVDDTSERRTYLAWSRKKWLSLRCAYQENAASDVSVQDRAGESTEPPKPVAQRIAPPSPSRSCRCRH